MVNKVIKETVFYDIESFVPQEDGTIKHLHSNRFLDGHHERRDDPEFTEEEEQIVINLLKYMNIKII